MNAKKKITQSILTMVSMILITIFAGVMAVSMKDIQNKASATAFVSYGVAASVSGNYYVGDNSFKMYSGENDKIIFSSYDDESFPALNANEDIKLTSKNNYVVYEYRFENDSNENSFIASFSQSLEVENMDVSYGYSYEKLTDFNLINKKDLKHTPVFKGENNEVYLYIKVKVSNLNRSSRLSGTFCFNLTTVDAYEIKLVNGLKSDKIYAALGFELNDIDVPNKEGFKFEGYFTKANGKGEMIFDENGQTDKIMVDEKIDKLYAHYSQI